MTENEIKKLQEENERLKKLTPKSNNEKLLIGIIVGAFVGFVVIWGLNIASDYQKEVYLIFISIFIFIAILFLLTVWFRNRIIKKFFGKDVDFTNIIEDSQSTINIVSEKVVQTLPIESTDKEKIKLYAPRIISFLLWSNYRNWALRVMLTFVAGCSGLVVTMLTLNQNKLFESQNKKMDQQTQLVEASRRSSQMFIMGEVFSDLNKELNDSLNVNGTLSNTLVGRIISLSRSMKPYKYLQSYNNGYSDSLEFTKLISPERGQLLITLLRSNMDSVFFQNNILGFYNSDFSYAELNNANLIKSNLVNVNLEYANLSVANLYQANLKTANLRGANLNDANLRAANLRDANLNNADLKRVNLIDANLRKAYLIDVYLNDADLSFSNLRNAKLNNANLSGAILRTVNLRAANLKGANLRGADLTGANLTNVISLDSVKVDRYDWLTFISDSLKLGGSEKIFNEYMVDSITYKMPNKDKTIITPMLIRKK